MDARKLFPDMAAGIEQSLDAEGVLDGESAVSPCGYSRTAADPVGEGPVHGRQDRGTLVPTMLKWNRPPVIFGPPVIFALLAALTLLPFAALRAQPLPPPAKLSPSSWAWIGPYGPPTKENGGFRMNMGFVVGGEAVAVIDSGYTDDMAAQMLQAIRSITQKPVRYVVNTTSQPHRFMGNATFEEVGAVTIAAVEAAERMQRDGAAFGQAVEHTLERPPGSVRLPGKPRRLVSEGGKEIVDLGGGVSLEIVHLGAAHTRGSLILSVRPDQVTFAGDILYGGRLPAILPEGNIGGWLSAYHRLASIDARRFVPGHGTPAPLREFAHPTLDYLRALKAHMDKQAKAGANIGPAVDTFDASPWRSLENFAELTRRNAYNAFLESESDF